MQASAGRRRMRNGSSHHNAYISGNGDEPRQRSPTSADSGKIVNRNADGVAVDHHQVDEVHRHLRDVVLEARQQHQHHDHGQRQRARQRRAAAAARSRGNSGCPRTSRKQSRELKSVSVWNIRPSAARCGRGDGKQPPNADRGEAGGGGRSRRTWIWRGRHRGDATSAPALPQARSGAGQEAHAAAGACDMS